MSALVEEGSAVLFEDERLRVSFEEGKSNEAVISFAGIGARDYRILRIKGSPAPDDNKHPTRIDEFRKTIGGTKNVYYVADKRRRWYNGLETEILDLINSHLAQRRTTRVLAIGNSMGGSAALMFASRINRCRQAIAFAPQSSVHPDLVPFESRWASYRDEIAEWTCPDPIMSMVDGPRRYYIFYGMDEPLDEEHIQRVLALGLRSVVVFGIESCGHDVALQLRKSGIQLGDILLQAANGTPNDVRAVIKDVPHRVFRRFKR